MIVDAGPIGFPFFDVMCLPDFHSDQQHLAFTRACGVVIAHAPRTTKPMDASRSIGAFLRLLRYIT
jgi:hypothetical protein